MFKTCLTTAALLAVLTQGAAADFVDWRNGTAVVKAATAVCEPYSIIVGDAFSARYRHPNLGDNGALARISVFGRRVAHHISKDGDFNNTFQTADFAAFVGGGIVTSTQQQNPYVPSIRMTKRSPGTINETTKQIYLYFKNFFVNTGINGCNLDLEMTVVQ